MSSISSGRKSSTPSILKRPSKLKITPGQKVKFQIDGTLKELLLNFISDKNKNAYVDIICKIRDSGNQLSDEQLISLINETKECISILNQNLKLFVQVLLLLKWVHRGDEAIQEFKHFILDLCSAHNYYTKFALQQLVTVFSEEDENSIPNVCIPSELEEKRFRVAHEVIRSLLKIVPMSKDVLLSIMKRKFPFRTESDRRHLNYVHNLLIVATYESTLRRNILILIITNLIHLDTISSKEEIEHAECSEIFAMDVDDVTLEEDMKHDSARKLDYCLHRLLKYVQAECHHKNGSLKWDKAKILYQDFLFIFENVILSTFGCQHTQFVILYLISFSSKFSSEFLSFLWNKVTNPNVAAVIREAAVGYLVGVLSHASFVSLGMIKTYLQIISVWLHQYVDNVRLKDEFDTMTIVRKHGVFYASCQALFYLVNMRHADFVGNEKNLKLLANLNLGKIVMSRLKPLLVCAKHVVNSFIEITKTYQLLYCVTILSETKTDSSIQNIDLWLDGYFPFSCYLLRRSNEYINPIRRPSCLLAADDNVKTVNDDDDFVPAGSLSHSPRVPSLGSPFFSCLSGMQSC